MASPCRAPSPRTPGKVQRTFRSSGGAFFENARYRFKVSPSRKRGLAARSRSPARSVSVPPPRNAARSYDETFCADVCRSGKRSCRIVGSSAVSILRPPPDRRSRIAGSRSAVFRSRRPRWIVDREIPVARTTKRKRDAPASHGSRLGGGPAAPRPFGEHRRQRRELGAKGGLVHGANVPPGREKYKCYLGSYFLTSPKLRCSRQRCASPSSVNASCPNWNCREKFASLAVAL